MNALQPNDRDLLLLASDGASPATEDVIYGGPFAYGIGLQSAHRLYLGEYNTPVEDVYWLSVLMRVNSAVLLMEKKIPVVDLSQLKKPIIEIGRYKYSSLLIKKALEFVGPEHVFWTSHDHICVIVNSTLHRAATIAEVGFGG